MICQVIAAIGNENNFRPVLSQLAQDLAGRRFHEMRQPAILVIEEPYVSRGHT